MFRNTQPFSSFSVDDIQAAKAFYSQTLGLDIIENSDMGILEVRLAGGQSIFIYGKPNHVPATFTVFNFPIENIDQAVDALTKAGVVFEQYEGDIATDEKGIHRGPIGPQIAWFKDPAGNILSVLEKN
jgi:predicted enzyme related to lactoylglutathione lyase